MQNLTLSAGARVYAQSSNGKITDPLSWDVLVAVSNGDGTPVTLDEGPLEFAVFVLNAGELGHNAVIPVTTQVDTEGAAYGFYHLVFSQQEIQNPENEILIPKIIAVQATFFHNVVEGNPPRIIPSRPIAQGRTVCGVTGEPGYYGLDIVPSANAQFFLGCVKNNS
jgi:hypothetical protein